MKGLNNIGRASDRCFAGRPGGQIAVYALNRRRMMRGNFHD